MTIDYAALKARQFPDVRADYDWKDSVIYALGVGYGLDPVDPAQLRFVYERAQLAVPTLAVVLATPGVWIREPDSGIDWVRVLHGEQQLVLHRPLPVSASVIGRTAGVSITDKGERAMVDREGFGAQQVRSETGIGAAAASDH